MSQRWCPIIWGEREINKLTVRGFVFVVWGAFGVGYAEQASTFFLRESALYFYNINEFFSNAKAKGMTCFEGCLVKGIVNCFEFGNGRSVRFEVVDCVKVPNKTESTKQRSKNIWGTRNSPRCKRIICFHQLVSFLHRPISCYGPRSRGTGGGIHYRCKQVVGRPWYHYIWPGYIVRLTLMGASAATYRMFTCPMKIVLSVLIRRHNCMANALASMSLS